MNDYKERLRLQRRILIITLFAIIVVTAILIIKGEFVKTSEDSNEHLFDFMYGARFGIVIAAIVNVLYFIVGISRKLNSEEKLKAGYIKSSDERKKLIVQNASAITVGITYSILVISVIIATFVNMVVAATIIAVLILLRCTYTFTYIYYRNKY